VAYVETHIPVLEDFKMEEMRKQQLEALEIAVPYCKRMSAALEQVIKELKGDKQEDTDTYINDVVLKGLNWIFSVFNGTQDIVNEKEVIIDKDKVNESVQMLNEGNTENDDNKRAEALEGILQFVNDFLNISMKISSAE